MKIAILGATSQIAKDLISSFSNEDTQNFLYLFTRQPEKLKTWMYEKKINKKYFVTDYDSFNEEKYDAIINFVGIGDPQKAIDMGLLIFDITTQYDQLALDYLRLNQQCKYIFLSSGAVYGDVFNEPANEKTRTSIAINELHSSNWYSIAKLYAEARHRALKDYSIVDIRIFNYFSHSQDMRARFLITDIIRAIRDGNKLLVSQENIFRDYIGPKDFSQLITILLAAKKLNTAIDCYSSLPIDKISLLEEMHKNFGLRYEASTLKQLKNATGKKIYYYSTNFRAGNLGYFPKNTSLENIIFEARLTLAEG